MRFTHMTVGLSIGLSMAVNGFAHGEKKPGPHGGYIQMPGPFHTELVIALNKELRIYLLDMKNENPVTRNSSVALKFRSKALTSEADCTPKKDFFACPLPEKFSLKEPGQIHVNATRDGAKGVEMIYSVPLKHEIGKLNPEGSHGTHGH